ncbi:hypothetical protein DV738_g4588, partial [Chaetothyriales sp. CBS 135597]
MNAPSGGALGQPRPPRLQGSNNDGRGSPVQTDSYQNRAAQFEQEKRRIIDSCFSKLDDDGMQLESYITHVRVIEDSMSPSSPPPPDSAANNKKNRVILVAVRRSGKVRVHKARENANGTFSIGKTWSLDELTAIQSYTGLQPSNQQERLERQWAGLVGFIVSLGKPYFWQATTPKEKDFFIASLVKIYRKYTGGRVPQLIGFAPSEIEQLVGQAQVRQNGVSSPPPGSRPPTAPGQRPPTRSALRPGTSDRERAFSPPEQKMASGDRPLPPPLQRPQRQPSAEPLASPRLRQPLSPSPLPRPDEQGNRAFAPNRQNSPQNPFAPRTPSRSDAGPPAQVPPPLFSGPKSPRPPLSQQPERGLDGGLPARPARPGAVAAALAALEPSRRIAPSKSADSVAPGPESGRSTPATAYSDIHSPDSAPPVPKTADQDRAASVESIKPRMPGQFPQSTPVSTGTGADSYFSIAGTSQSNDSQKPKSEAVTSPAVTSPLQSPTEEKTSEPASPEDDFRPGLGPMVKKKSTREIAAQFRKAALAATAFQPRQGGAGARLRAMQDKQSTEPDGITSVVPAPLLRGISADTTRPASPGLERPRAGTPLANAVMPKLQLLRSATEDSLSNASAEKERPGSSLSNSVTGTVEDSLNNGGAKAVTQDQAVSFVEPPKAVEQGQVAEVEKATGPGQSLEQQPRSSSPQRKKRQRQELEAEKLCNTLGLDVRVLEGRGLDFTELLTEFGWEGRLTVPGRKLDHFDSDIRREIGRAQATGWLGHLDQQENRLHDLARAFDKTLVECDEMDGLLTLYSHELNTLADDIEYIQAQSQGLQVSTANQKLLQTELQSLLKTLTISPADLQALERAPLDDNDGIVAIERALVLLHQAMLTIDPDIRSNRKRQEAASAADRSGLGIYADTDIGQMRAVRQKKDAYREQSLTFVRRFNQHIIALFKSAEQNSSQDLSRNSGSGSTLSGPLPALKASRLELWVYSPMMLFIREVNSYEWQTLISSYEINIKSAYLDYFRDTTLAQRKNARKPTGEEQEALFTHQEKEVPATAARKLTVKRSKTTKPAAGLRQQLDNRRDGKPDAWEVFDALVQDQANLISEEQNFIVHLFHLRSSANLDFADEASIPPARRLMPNLSAPLAYDADRDMAKIVLQAVEGIFQFWASDLQSLVDWVLKSDPLQAVGVLRALEEALAIYEDTNQEYITRTLRQIHDRLVGLLHKFVDDQVRAIEETKVKVKKRKGVISFIRTLPIFISAVESMMAHETGQKDTLEVRFILNDIYSKILKTMWESLNFIAKDNPASGPGAQSQAPNSGDPEDKEALNYHILLIENMNHFIEEVDCHGNVVLEEWAEKAEQGLRSHLIQYTNAVIQRPLGKWLDFIESTEALMKVTEPTAYASIASKPSHSRSTAKKLLAAYDSKEVRKGAETLKRRIEKHFGDVDDGTIIAWDRMKTIIDSVYDGSLEIDWRKDEIVSVFTR